MKFLLTAVNAKFIHSNPAIYSLRAYAGEELGRHVELAEYTINQQLHTILADIYLRKPDAIGFSCYIWNWKMIRELIEELPKILPDTAIWLGGPEVSYDAPKIMEAHPQLTGIMVGEGEETFRELLAFYVEQAERESSAQSRDGLATGEDAGGSAPNRDRLVTEEDVSDLSAGGMITDILSAIPGLCLRGGYTAPRTLTDLGKVPFLYDNLSDFDNRIIYYESSRGCPYRCSYCLSSIDKSVRLRDIHVVKKELQFFLDKKVPQVKFIDRTFNCDHDHAMEIWRYIYEHDNGITNFHFEISADILNEDELGLLARFRPGLAQLEIGVQSTNAKTLRAIHRAMDVERLEGIVATIWAGRNIHMHLDLIAGLPYEDYDSFIRSFNRVYAMGPDQLQLGFLKVLKGSEMEERAGEYGIRYLSEPPYEVLSTPWLPYGDVLRLKEVEEMVELYYNSNQYTHTLPFLVHAFESPFHMFEGLAVFYSKNGYFRNSPARAYRYQVLLDFAVSCDPQHEAVYKELLTFDLYLRENAKSRPKFASDLTDGELKERIRRFYQKEETEHKVLSGYEAYDWKQMSKMTHMEAFHYPVMDLEDPAKAIYSKKPYLVLFDYRNRSPLTHEATVTREDFVC